MRDKIFDRLIYELSKNCRSTTKRLGQVLRVSQQSASYAINSAIKNKILLGYHTVIDPAKLGLINVIVLFNFLDFDQKKINEIKEYLDQSPYVTSIEAVSLGADLLVEYCVPNLSLFNKENKNLLYKFKRSLKALAVYPVIVKHIYNRKYLCPKQDIKEIILSGDRSVARLNPYQTSVLKILNADAKKSILSIANRCNIDTKTVVKIKRRVESNNIIRGYSIIFDHRNIGINREFAFINFDSDDQKEMSKFLTFCRFHKNIITVIKLIGNYDMLLIIESRGQKEIINELRKEFNIPNYQIIRSTSQIKQISVPDIIF